MLKIGLACGICFASGRRFSLQDNRDEVTPMEATARKLETSATTWSPGPDASDVVKSIHAMLHPRNIVVVGATDKPGNYAERIWNNLVKYQYAGGMYPIN